MSLVWKIEFSESAKKDLRKLDNTSSKKIIIWLDKRILSGVDPRLWGKKLKGSLLGDMWRYRVGDYRILCLIKDEVVTVEVVSIVHRKDVYS